MNGFFPQVMWSLPEPVQVGPNDSAEGVLCSWLCPADVLEAGSMFSIQASGIITTVAGQPVLDFRLRVGPVTLTGAATVAWKLFTSNNQTDKTWTLEGDFTIQPDGLSVWGQGALETTVNTQYQFGWVGTDQAAAVAFDPTIDNLIELTADWDDLAANSVKVTNASLSLIPPVPA